MKTLFGKKRSGVSYPPPSSPITATFAQEMLELEERLNINCSLPIVTRLISLYTKAIEFYESEQNLKHLHYQERLHHLLSKTNVLFLFKSSNIGSPKVHNSPRQVTTELVLERNCEKVLKDHMSGNFNVAQKIQDNLKGQAESLTQRIMMRKLTHSPKSDQKFLFDESSTDRDSGTNNPVEEFEKEVEEILEKCLNEKNKAKKEIKEKYQQHFDETQHFHGEIKEMLVNELKNRMLIEINQAFTDADLQRNDEVANARQKLNSRI